MVSLGCAKNRVDAELMLGLLKQEGHEIVAEPGLAEVIIVNTCGFIEAAKQESIDAILEMAEFKREGCRALIVTGCLSQRYGKELAAEMPEADAILGLGQTDQIAQAVNKALLGEKTLNTSGAYRYVESVERVLSTGGPYAYLKISDGCSNRCSYCAIPSIRGPHLSRPMEEILREAKSLCAQGVKELVLVAQDSTRYGIDLYGEAKLEELLCRLCALPETTWIRVLYCYPDMLSDSLLQLMHDEPKICAYLDIPLQHVHDRILKEMNRHGGHALIDALYHRIRALGGFALRSTVICGFPGESDEEFEFLLQYLKEQPFDRLGAFAYSQEEGTEAGEREDQLPPKLRKTRAGRLMRQQKAISKAFNRSRVGSEVEVLIEGEELGLYFGRSRWEAPEIDGLIYIELAEGLRIGDIVRVKLTQAKEYDMLGVLA
jgi:ribosomal protein S12 methylthiotransferase